MQHVTNLMDPIDVLDLSFCSKRAKVCARTYRALNKHCNIITRTTFDKKVGVQIVFSDQTTLSWWLWKEINPKKLTGYQTIQSRKVGGVTFEISAKEMSSNTLLASCDNLEVSVKFITEYVLSVFPCTVHTVELDIKLFSDFKFLSNWDTVKKCEALRVRAGGHSTKDDLEDVMSLVTKYESLEIIEYDKEPFFNQKMASMEQLKLMDAFLLSEENFFKLNCKTIELGENEYDNAMLNKIMKKWYSKELENLQVLSIVMEHIELSDLQPIFEGIQLKKWDPKAHHRYYKKSSSMLFDCKNGFDILRSDGKLATVLFADYSFNFMVWNERFPDLSLSPLMYYSRNPKHPIVYVKKLGSTQFDIDLVVDVNAV